MPAPKTPFTKPPVVSVPRYPNGEYVAPPRQKSKTGHWYQTRVIDGDSWLSLAALDGWADVWDLIEANFQTRDPDVVNWYLKEYVGCVDMTADHNNYRFTNKARPGVIYTQTRINRTGAPDFDALFRLVQGALGHSAVWNVRFKLDGYWVTPSLLHEVKGCVARGWIRLEYRPKLKADGTYYPGYDKLVLRSAAASPANQAMIIHEATHAALDWSSRGARSINEATSEALAYVAQSVFHHHATGGMLVGDADEGQIFSAADVIVTDMVDWQIRRQLAGDAPDVYTVPKAQADALMNAIDGSTRYSGAKTRYTRYDGVDGPFGE